MSCCRRGEYCYVLNARQMGKSSLRLQTMARLQAAGVVCGAMDFSVAGGDGPGVVFLDCRSVGDGV
ncbi:MAG: hypothetical protein HC860_25850 [Alkalinema sp. RU_4_3]|nr:hypothetical protein [Alkalinema sp. RU_4_3]